MYCSSFSYVLCLINIVDFIPHLSLGLFIKAVRTIFRMFTAGKNTAEMAILASILTLFLVLILAAFAWLKLFYKREYNQYRFKVQSLDGRRDHLSFVGQGFTDGHFVPVVLEDGRNDLFYLSIASPVVSQVRRHSVVTLV